MSNINPNILKSIFNVIVQDMHIARDLDQLNISIQTFINTLNTQSMTVQEIIANLQLFSQEITDNKTKLILQTDTLCSAYDSLLS